MSEFTAFVERPEKVEAFQFTGPHQAERVLELLVFPMTTGLFTGRARLTGLNSSSKGVRAR